MIARFSKLLSVFEQEPSANEHDLQLACAVLLVELMRVDAEISEQETQALKSLVGERFQLSEAEKDELLRRAEERATESVSLQTYTRQLTDQLDEEERGRIVGLLWELAYADGVIDKYEEDLLRKFSNLLYVRHSEFIRQKLLAAKKNRS